MIGELLERMHRTEIIARVVDGKLELDAPRGVLTDPVLSVIRRHKEELIRALSQRKRDPDPTPDVSEAADHRKHREELL